VSGFGVLAGGAVAWRDGDEAVDLRGLGDVFAQPSLDGLLALGREGWAQAIDAARAHDGPRTRGPRLRLPFTVADYVDFYSSLEHATNLGRLFRPDAEPVLPNWRWLPVGYHGRAGTVVVSGTDVVRPQGQLGAGVYGPSQRLDVELELGFVVGVPSEPDTPLAPGAFEDHVFGVVLVDDWSARDIQAWEYQPLGPFAAGAAAAAPPRGRPRLGARHRPGDRAERGGRVARERADALLDDAAAARPCDLERGACPYR
jgi:fumarylacetoacetase